MKNLWSVKTLILLVASVIFLSCNRDGEDPVVRKKPSGEALEERFTTKRKDVVQSTPVVLDNSTGDDHEVSWEENGVKIIIPPNSLGLNGSPVSGEIEIELIELYSRADMLLTNMPTSGVRANGDVEALKSAGEFYINATQNGEQLEILSPLHVQGRALDVDFGDVEAMQVFKAGDNLEDTDIWDEVEVGGINDIAGVGEVRNADGSYSPIYLFDVSSFGWTNLDRWYNFTGQLTNIFIDVPDEFDGSNCEVYLTYDGEPASLARMDIYDTTLEMFTEHYGRIPVGQDVHIILVADIGGQLHYTIQGTTIVDGHTEVMASPQPTTEAELITLINDLP
ncbi:MAG: hypothetical protein L3J29_09775 [Cyclobacteriaceae bacterium]|nr:hypothetical protein [Cyclobacteriaceae bacterium]